MFDKNQLVKVKEFIYEIPSSLRPDMRVPGRVFASAEILDQILTDQSLEQVINVAAMPGIVGWSLAMPDVHEGYGFSVGGVAAFDINAGGVISPGGIGFDINCGVRLIKTGASFGEIKSCLPALTNQIYKEVPAGVGRGGLMKLSLADLNTVLARGSRAMADWGYAVESDLKNCESGGCLEDAVAELVSERAKKRGRDQLGTMGAGNHFVEIQKVADIFDFETAGRLGLFEGEIVIMIHCGSRGLGHQVATDYIKDMLSKLGRYGITLPDRQLACAPFNSKAGQNYFQAMSAAANFAWANRQLITHEVRQAWRKVIGSSQSLELVYDVCHNIAKVENHKLNGRRIKAVVHRKGATRSFPGQPVIIPGSMGTASFVLIGAEQSMWLSFGSACHGAGRVMSRTKARKLVRGAELKRELESKGINISANSMAGLAEEAPEAYKDVDEVVRVVAGLGLAKKVAKLKPVGVVKG